MYTLVKSESLIYYAFLLLQVCQQQSSLGAVDGLRDVRDHRPRHWREVRECPRAFQCHRLY